MAPYQSRREEAPRVAPTTGLVTDMVRQFADPYAFLRELAQNGIDAGATAIEVSIERLPEGILATSVADDGCGMTREIIEGPLLTLFSSSKENDSSKIGKYGVGFVSIFALDPDEVQVSTGRDGESWLLRLFRDHSYQLEMGGPRSASGTKVTLLMKLQEKTLAAPGAAFEEHAALALAALRDWCRHAQCPITLTVMEHGNPEGRRTVRVDTPIAIEAPVSVSETIESEVFVVGVSAGSEFLAPSLVGASEAERGATFAGFYNRGLKLFDTDQPLSDDLRGIRFKVMSPHLQHTLSRDNVRRDAAFERIMGKVRSIVKGSLRKKVVSEVASSAELAAKGEERGRYAALLEAAQSPALSIKPSLISFPLTDPLPVSGERAVRDFSSYLSRGDSLLTAKDGDALTAALAIEGRIVIRCGGEAVLKAIRWCSKYPIEEAHRVYALVRELAANELTDTDRLLCKEVHGAVEAAGEAVARVALCHLEGAGETLVAIVVPDGEPQGNRPYPMKSIRSWWRRWTRRRVLLLNADIETVDFARRRAASDSALSGHLLARSLMLRDGDSISVGANEGLLERAGKGVQ